MGETYDKFIICLCKFVTSILKLFYKFENFIYKIINYILSNLLLCLIVIIVLSIFGLVIYIMGYINYVILTILISIVISPLNSFEMLNMIGDEQIYAIIFFKVMIIISICLFYYIELRFIFVLLKDYCNNVIPEIFYKRALEYQKINNLTMGDVINNLTANEKKEYEMWKEHQWIYKYRDVDNIHIFKINNDFYDEFDIAIGKDIIYVKRKDTTKIYVLKLIVSPVSNCVYYYTQKTSFNNGVI